MDYGQIICIHVCTAGLAADKVKKIIWAISGRVLLDILLKLFSLHRV
jgi:hypothetical protein